MSATFPADDLARRAAELEQRASAGHPESWRPDDAAKGHSRQLTGIFVRLDEASTQLGPAKIVVIRDLEGRDWGVWLLHTVLRNEFRRQRPTPGELVTVRYEGRKLAKNPQPGKTDSYEAYAVAVERGQVAAADWDDLARPGDDAVPATAAELRTGAGELEQEPAPAGAVICDSCGFRNGYHQAGCQLDPNGIPF